jgi:DNA primase
MITNFSIRQVQDRLDVLDVVGNFVQLKRRGANYLGNCPFHNEKTPSFTVSPAKGIYKCFGCGKAGNTITFVQEHEKLTYPEAIRWLAKRYNIELEETAVTPEIIEAQKIEESLRIINDYAQKYFTDNLLKTTEGQDIGWSYFKERGFRQETIDKFLLGYAFENRQSFVTKALNDGYKKELLQKCGLIAEKDDRTYDTYGGRVIFPIQNISGKVIGFGARILKKNDKAPKYINTPENEIYNKSRTLYGLFQARTAIGKLDEVYLAEGYTDVISLHQAGVENVVASSGTSLTVEQLKLIKRYTKNLTIIYDGDAAGIKAALRGLDMAIEESLNVQLVLLPDGHDPDSYVQEAGASGFTDYVNANKKDIILFKLEISLKEADGDSVKKANLINEIADTISKINKVEEFTKQQDYINRCAQLLGIDESGLISLVNKKIREKIVKNNQFAQQEEERAQQAAQPDDLDGVPINEAATLLLKDYTQEKGLIKLLVEYGDKPFDEKINVAKYILHKIGLEQNFEHNKWQRVYSVYFNYLQTTATPPSIEYFTLNEDDELRNAVIEATYNPYEVSENWKNTFQIEVPIADDVYLQTAKSCVTYFLIRKLKTIMDENMEQLKNKDITEEEASIYMQSQKQIKEIEKELLKELKVVMYR